MGSEMCIRDSVYGEVVGEVSELTVSAKGHVYFSLKDKDTGYVLPSTIWRSRYALNGLKLELGAEVLVKGRPDFYGPFGKLSFIAQTIELVGEGALKNAYDKLKVKLAEEGFPKSKFVFYVWSRQEFHLLHRQ